MVMIDPGDYFNSTTRSVQDANRYRQIMQRIREYKFRSDSVYMGVVQQMGGTTNQSEYIKNTSFLSNISHIPPSYEAPYSLVYVVS